MEKVEMSEQPYELVIAYQENDEKRDAFNVLVNSVFSFSFESWYQNGYWSNKYIPYTLFSNNLAVSNVSVNIIDFKFNNSLLKTVQIGTVVTNKAFRNRSLCKYLMNLVINEWRSKCDLLYLFANTSSVNLYPKFGFNLIVEHECEISKMQNVIKKPSNDAIRCLDMTKVENKNILYEKAQRGNKYAALTMTNNPELIMFYCTSVFSNSVYYYKSQDLIIIAKQEDTTLFIYDIFGSSNLELDIIIDTIAKEFKNITNIRFGFTPYHAKGFTIKKRNVEDTLFILDKHTNIFNQYHMMFPLLSHA